MATNNAINLKNSGIVSYDAAGTFAGRTLTGTTNQIAVTNGSGVSANPTIALSPIVVNATQPCVVAYKSAISTNQTGNNTTVTVIFDTVITDQGSNYNSGTGVFTAPVTGKYLVGAQVEYSNVLTVAYFFEMSIVATARTWTGGDTGGINSVSATHRFASCCAIIDMAANDTFHITAVANGQAADTIGIFGDVKPLTFLTVNLLC